jgi:hypothetical protein
VVDGESDSGSQTEPLVTLSIVQHPSGMSEGDGVGHVDHNGVSVSERDLGLELTDGRPRVTESNDTIKHELVQVSRLQLIRRMLH